MFTKLEVIWKLYGRLLIHKTKIAYVMISVFRWRKHSNRLILNLHRIERIERENGNRMVQACKWFHQIWIMRSVLLQSSLV